MDMTLTVRYLKNTKTIDISSNSEFFNIIESIKKIIINRIKPLYKFILLYNEQFNEQMFKEVVDEFINVNVGNYIKRTLKEYLKEHREINIEGFIMFRLKELWNVIDESVDEYLLKKEYLMLTEYLSNLTENSESIYDKIIIFVNDDNYTIYNKDEEIICFLKKYDDSLLDIILNIAPDEIYFVGIEKFENKLLLKDISDIFKNRLVFL